MGYVMELIGKDGKQHHNVVYDTAYRATLADCRKQVDRWAAEYGRAYKPYGHCDRFSKAALLRGGAMHICTLRRPENVEGFPLMWIQVDVDSDTRERYLERQSEGKQEEHYDVVSAIIRYESGQMAGDEEVIELFQHLINTGLAWTLQGSYGRTAYALIQDGVCTQG